MANITVVIPYAAYHAGLLERAVQSCQQQTFPVQVITVYDAERKGAGWARNQGLAHAQTPYVVFLDADDQLLPTFAERCLRIIRPGRYVYTDWLSETERHYAPSCAWVNGSWHVNTTLLFTEDVRRINGYDEALIAGEDSEFYAHLTRSGVCGLRLAEPLFKYGSEGGRSKTFVNSPEREALNQLLSNRYGDQPMACCGQKEDLPVIPPGEGLPGDVLAKTLWQGSRHERGRVTGRLYKGGWEAEVYVDQRDLAAAPHLFESVGEFPDVAEDDDFAALAAFARQGMNAPRRPNTPAPLQVVPKPANAKADMGRVLELYRQNS